MSIRIATQSGRVTVRDDDGNVVHTAMVRVGRGYDDTDEQTAAVIAAAPALFGLPIEQTDDELEPELDLDALKERAGELGIKPGNMKAETLAAKIAEAEAAQLADLRSTADEAGIEFTDETTAAELAELIAEAAA